MADAKIAIAKTLVHEGGYQNEVTDWANWKGGKQVMEQYLQTKNAALLPLLVGTKYGLTVQDLPDYTAQMMRDLSPETATEYYQEHYWKPLYSQITRQDVAEKLFDMGVLFGVGTAVKLLQISVNEGGGGNLLLVSDGEFGEETLADVNKYADVPTYRKVLIQHAINIVNNNPLEKNDINGWVTRINL